MRRNSDVHSISAVIPTLNEAGFIRSCIAALMRQPEIIEIIVADGGSVDDTRSIAGLSGAEVVRCPRRGRGFQISDGIARAAGDVIFVIHGDCRLQNGAAGNAIAALNADPCLVGGAFGMAFESRIARLRAIALLNNVRARYTGVSFGDQGQFFRREVLARIGGFPKQMLMEDVELSLRLKSVGPVVLIPAGISVSERRWESRPFFPHVWRVFHLFGRYMLTRRIFGSPGNAEEYYRKYYDRD